MNRKEDVAYVLDYLPYGRSDDSRPLYKKKPIVQAIGEKQLALMEMIPKENVHLKTHDRVYIGGDSPVIDYRKYIAYNELTQKAKIELPIAIKRIVLANENGFLSLFFNETYPNKTRSQWLGLSPGTCYEIIEERKKRRFESFDDIAARVKGLREPEELIIYWILDNIKFYSPYQKRKKKGQRVSKIAPMLIEATKALQKAEGLL